jgi:hypothetical protein
MVVKAKAKEGVHTTGAVTTPPDPITLAVPAIENPLLFVRDRPVNKWHRSPEIVPTPSPVV